jgi:subtilisin family serine protease
MDSVPGSFDIVGVAPEATIYMYKALDCTGGGGSDTIMAAMLKAYEDGVDLISMSIGITQENAGWDGGDPLADVTQSITNAGIAVVVAMSNDVGASPNGNDIYTERWPRHVVTSIFVLKANRRLKRASHGHWSGGYLKCRFPSRLLRHRFTGVHHPIRISLSSQHP